MITLTLKVCLHLLVGASLQNQSSVSSIICCCLASPLFHFNFSSEGFIQQIPTNISKSGRCNLCLVYQVVFFIIVGLSVQKIHMIDKIYNFIAHLATSSGYTTNIHVFLAHCKYTRRLWVRGSKMDWNLYLTEIDARH